jgi:hypothetical protein
LRKVITAILNIVSRVIVAGGLPNLVILSAAPGSYEASIEALKHFTIINLVTPTHLTGKGQKAIWRLELN